MTTALLARPMQAPQLIVCPPAPASAADEAIEIYEMCGGRLDDWQELCLRNGCGLRENLQWASFENGVIVARQNGKGAIIEALLLASFFVWGNKVTIYSAHRGDTVKSTLKRVRELILGTPELLRRCKPINPSDEFFELLTGATLEFRTRTRSGGRGLTGDFVVFDEALECDPDQMAALAPTMLARPYAQMWYFSTVPKFGDAHLCLVRDRVLAGDKSVSWVEWGADNKNARLDDPDQLAKANPALGIRISLERLAELRGILGDERFKTECLSIWPASVAGQLLDPKVWQKWAGDGGMHDPGSHRAPGSDVVMSMDMTVERDFGSIGMHGFRDDGLEHLQLTDYEMGIDWMVGAAERHRAVLDPALWVIDAKNGVHAFLDALWKVGIREPHDPKCGPCLRRECRKAEHRLIRRGNLLVLNAEMQADCVGQFVDGFRKDPVIYRHIGQEALNRAVGSVKQRPIGEAGQIGWARRNATVDIGPVVVVSQARYGSYVWQQVQGKMKAKSKVW